MKACHLVRIMLIAVPATILIAGADADGQPGQPLVTLTGSISEIDHPRWRLASSQETFDEHWIAHMGDRVTRAAQGWPMPPRLDFTRCEAVFIFGGDRINSNGFRVVDVIEEDDAVTIRYESISYQTASFDGEDHGDAARPWAVLVLPSTDRTILLEENVQSIIGREPLWKQRAAFPGVIGVGRPVAGTAQQGSGSR